MPRTPVEPFGSMTCRTANVRVSTTLTAAATTSFVEAQYGSRFATKRSFPSAPSVAANGSRRALTVFTTVIFSASSTLTCARKRLSTYTVRPSLERTGPQGLCPTAAVFTHFPSGAYLRSSPFASPHVTYTNPPPAAMPVGLAATGHWRTTRPSRDTSATRAAVASVTYAPPSGAGARNSGER